MSYTHSSGVASARSRVEYLLYGKGEMRQNHLTNGTDRVAAMVCTMGDLDAFVDYAESMATKGRKLQGYGYIQSFKNTELDPNNPYDVQAVNNLGLELALRLNPDAEHLVVTHIDGKGHGGCGAHPHNHILTANDDGHGKAIQRGKLHSHVRVTNDALMRENNLSTIDVRNSPERTTEDQATYWADVRGKMASFDAYLGDLVTEARNASIGLGLDVFQAELKARNVELITSENNDESPTWTYRTRDTTDGKNRLRRRKAEKLATDLDAPTVSLMVQTPALTPSSTELAVENTDYPNTSSTKIDEAIKTWGQGAEGVAADTPQPDDESSPLAYRARSRKSREQLEKELKKLPPARRQYILRNTPRRRGPSGPNL